MATVVHAPQEAVAKEYAQLAESYDKRWAKYTAATLKATLARLPPLPDDAVVVELACGTGAVAEALARRPEASKIGLYVGVDITESMLQVARAKAVKFPFKSEWHLGAADSSLSLESSSADVVIVANALHYFAEPERAVAEATRVLKPGGALLCGDWCGDYATCKLLEWWLKVIRAPVHHVLGLKEARRLLSRELEVAVSEQRRLLWFWGFMVIVAARTSAEGR